MSTATPKTPRRSGGIRDIGKMFGGSQSSLRQFGILGALVAIIIIFQILTGGRTLLPGNVINIVNANAYVLILAIGMVMVIIAGHIDLSVGSVAAFTGIVVAMAMTNWHLPWPVAVLIGLAVGALIGAWQGFWVAYVGVPAFIVTLAGMLIFRGANQFVGDSTSLTTPAEFKVLGGGYLPDFGPDFGYSNPTLLIGLLAAVAVVVQEVMLRRKQVRTGADRAPLWVSILKVLLLVGVIVFASLLFGGGRVGTSIPVSGLILIAFVLIYSFVANRTVIGRHIYAVGGNWHAAELSGVNIKRTNFFVMMNMSVLAAIAGMIFVSRSQASGPQDGTGWELDAIAAVFIGGAAVSGGIGTVIGSIVGGLVIAVLNNGLQLLGAGQDQVQMIKGLVLLIAVAVDVISKRSGGRSIISRFSRTSAAPDAPTVLPAPDSAEASSRPPAAG